MNERDFFNEKTESKTHTLNCTGCRTPAEYEIRWIRRTRKPSPPRGASSDDIMRFKKARDYMVRADDVVRCKNPRCGKRIEITSLQSVILL